MDTKITLQTKQMIDNLKAVCANKGLGNASSEYKIITEVFLYKFLNDKFLFEAKKADKSLAELSSADVEEKLSKMSDDDYELFLLNFEVHLVMFLKCLLFFEFLLFQILTLVEYLVQYFESLRCYFLQYLKSSSR